MMNVLVACEESQIVCTAFREKGHNAFSCDVIDCSGGHPEWHIKQDVMPLLGGWCSFKTCDNVTHFIDGKWDLIIAHPPCTYLTPAGVSNIPKHPERIQLGYKAKEFFMCFIDNYIETGTKTCIENPPPMKRFNIPKYSQIIHPYDFGIDNTKKMAFWLYDLPELKPTDKIMPSRCTVTWLYKGKRKSCSKWYNTNTHKHSEHRSKFFEEIAEAMADQWG